MVASVAEILSGMVLGFHICGIGCWTPQYIKVRRFRVVISGFAFDFGCKCVGIVGAPAGFWFRVFSDRSFDALVCGGCVFESFGSPECVCSLCQSVACVNDIFDLCHSHIGLQAGLWMRSGRVLLWMRSGWYLLPRIVVAVCGTWSFWAYHHSRSRSISWTKACRVSNRAVGGLCGWWWSPCFEFFCNCCGVYGIPASLSFLRLIQTVFQGSGLFNFPSIRLT